MRNSTIAQSSAHRIILVGVAVLATAAVVVLLAPSQTRGYAGSGSCSGGHCYFCTDVTLNAYGSPNHIDRCAYGYFYGANTVEADHPSGAVLMCAGMKSASDGGGNNVAPIGVACSTQPTYSLLTGGADTTGYMTIINHDTARTHYHWSGQGSY